jgi:hypothetical protein
VDVGSVANISNVYTASIFTVKMCRVGEFMFFKTTGQWVRMVVGVSPAELS